MIVKIETTFFIFLKPDYRDLIQKHSTNVLLLLPDKSANKLTVIGKINYISKPLAELGLSNSKSKTNSKATHSIKEIISANISYC